MTRIVLCDKTGSEIRELEGTAELLISTAEEESRTTRTTKRRCLERVFRESAESAGFAVSDAALKSAMQAVDQLRAGKQIDEVMIGVAKPNGHASQGGVNERRGNERDETEKMARSAGSSGLRFFEDERIYPDRIAEVWFDRLVGIDHHKESLLLELELLLRPELVEQWSRTHHNDVLPACEIMTTRAPLIVLTGDVGCGKTMLAESVGDPLARRLGGHVHLLKINTQVRGTGMVGEMTDLISQAFHAVEEKAHRNQGEPVLLLIDEADSLASKRAEQHMHHEDKAGVNTLLQRIDRLRRERLPVAVVFITNRTEALDSAIRRRAALTLNFERPNDEGRAELFRRSFPNDCNTGAKLKRLITATGPSRGEPGYTASDITDRLIPATIKRAYLAQSPVTIELLLSMAQEMQATPAMEE